MLVLPGAPHSGARESNLRAPVVVKELNGQADIRVVGEAVNVKDGYEFAIALRPHIIGTVSAARRAPQARKGAVWRRS